MFRKHHVGLKSLYSISAVVFLTLLSLGLALTRTETATSLCGLLQLLGMDSEFKLN